MDIDRFWQLIEQARAKAGPAADQAVRDYDNPEDDPDKDYWDFDDLDIEPYLRAEVRTGEDLAPGEGDIGADAGLDDEDGVYDDNGEEEDEALVDPIAVALVEILAELPAAEIAAFDNIFDVVREQADREDLANAAILIEHGFLADDSFDDFRAGLVALGRMSYEAALINPDSLAEHPVVREIAQANDPRWLGREDLVFAASYAYANVTGEDEMAFFEFTEKVGDPPPMPEEAPEDTVRGDWAITDEAETRRRLPQLSDLFYERSMGNRQRALAKFGLTD